MKQSKKSIVVLGAVAIALLMVSSAAAVPQVQSRQISKTNERVEQVKTILTTRVKVLSNFTEKWVPGVWIITFIIATLCAFQILVASILKMFFV